MIYPEVDCGPRGSAAMVGRSGRFVRALVDKQLAIEDERPMLPGGARAVLLTGKAPYRALGIPDVRHRRAKDATTQVLMRRLLSLDYLIERPTLAWLPTGCFRHQLLLPRPYLVLTKPLRLDIQCQRAASVKIGWKYLDD